MPHLHHRLPGGRYGLIHLGEPDGPGLAPSDDECAHGINFSLWQGSWGAVGLLAGFSGWRREAALGARVTYGPYVTSVSYGPYVFACAACSALWRERASARRWIEGADAALAASLPPSCNPTQP
ncbi:hypothetical protein GCM10023324_11560 [Streptomyces youssoufiensis]